MTTKHEQTSGGPDGSERRRITVAEFFDRVPNDVVAEERLIPRPCPNGMIFSVATARMCRMGRSTRVSRSGARGCEKRFSARTSTVMANSNLRHRDWLFAVYAVLTNLKAVSSMKLRHDWEITQSSAWFLLHRIRETWATAGGDPFEGPSEIAEIYMVGNARKMHDNRCRKAIRGRDTFGKTPVVGVKVRDTNKVAAKPVRDTTAETPTGSESDATALVASIFTDDAKAHKPLASLGFRHVAVPHSVRVYVRGDVHTNGIESLWLPVKRGYVGVNHHMAEAQVGRNVNAFAGRPRIRPSGAEAQMASAAAGMVGKHLRYEDLTAAVPAGDPF